MSVELATAYISLVPSARGLTAGIQKEMGLPLVAAGQASGAKTSAAFGTSFKKGLKTAAIGVGVIAGIAAIGKSFEDSFNTIARGTGATGAVLEGLDNSFKTVLKSGSGSFDQVSQSITKLYQRTGLTGKALEDFASKEVTLARITKTDIGANLESTTALFNLFGVAAANQSDKLDVLFKASQLAGVTVTQLASDMQSAAPTAKILGLNIDQTASLVANLDKAGLPASRVMLGLATSFAKAAKQGREPVSVIRDLVAQVKAAPSATDAARIAVTRFGISARAAAVLVAGIRSGALDLNKSLDSKDAIEKAAAATKTLTGALAHLRNVAVVALEPLATDVLGAFTKTAQLAAPVLGVLTDHMSIVGPILIAATAGFAAFKIALGIQTIIVGASSAFTALSAAIFGTADAELAASIASKGLLASIGPIGFIAAAIGATLAVIAIKTHLFGKEQNDAGKATNTFIGSLLDEGKALKDVAGQLLVKAIRDNKQLGDTFKQIGVPLTTVNKALLGNKDALTAVSKAGVIGVRTGKISIDQYGQLTGFIIKNARSLHEQSDAKHRAEGASKSLAGAEKGTAGAAKSAAVAQDQLRIAATNLTTSIINSVDRLRGLEEGLVGVLQSAINLRSGLADLRDKQAAYNDAVKAGDPRKVAAALRDLQNAQLGQIGATDAAVTAAEKQADAQSHLSDHLKAQQQAVKDLAKANSDLQTGKGSPEAVAAAQDTLDRATKSVSASQSIQLDVLQHLADRVKGPLHVALLGFIGDMKRAGVKATPKITLDASQAFATLAEFRRRVNSIPGNVSFRQAISFEGGRVPGGAHGLVATKPQLAIIGENAATTPEIVSPVALMAETFKKELARTGHGGRPIVFTGPIQSWDDRDLARRLDDRARRAELLAGV